MKRVVILSAVALLIVGCTLSQDEEQMKELRERMDSLEQENAELREQVDQENMQPAPTPPAPTPTLYNDGAVKVKCQDLRSDPEYQDRSLIGGTGSRMYNIVYSPVLNTCVVEQMSIREDGEMWYALYDGLGPIGFRTFIEYDSRCQDSEEYKCTTWEEYFAEKERVLPDF